MPRIAYVDGQYVDYQNAKVHMEDRGYQFADGVYEVCEISNGNLIDRERHLERLKISLGELDIAMPVAIGPLRAIMSEVVRLNRICFGLIYLQITRGTALRSHGFPDPQKTKPVLTVVTHRIDAQARVQNGKRGLKIISVDENRWPLVYIKSISLLANVLAYQKARSQHAGEVCYITSEGFISECSSSNFWMINHDKVILTHPATNNILRGITRQIVLELIAQLQLPLQECQFSLDEAYRAKEVFITSATKRVMPVVQIDDRTINDGLPGKISRRLNQAFVERIKLQGG